MLSILNLFVAVILGLATGLVLQRGRICSNTIFRNLTLIKNDELFIIIILTIAVQLVGYEFLYFFDPIHFSSSSIPFSWLFLPIGSIIFGIGTVFAGGCAGGVCFRIGEGNTKSMIALLGFAVGIGLLNVNPLSNLFLTYFNQTRVQINDETPSLEMFLPRIIWTIVAVIISFGYIWRYYSLRKASQLKIKYLLPFWSPIISGIILGFIGIGMKIARNFSFSTIDGIGNVFLSIATFSLPNWAGFYIIGLIFGAFISSIQINEFHLKHVKIKEVIQFFMGGLALGLGAMMAKGCNFGHILGGIPELGISSLLAMPLMILGNWIGSYIFYIRFNHDLPISTPT